MSFSVDQFMQVKCKLQLTSESESSESIHTNCERVRLCASVELDRNNSTLIVMVCSNETSNNHILAYYIENRLHLTPDRPLPNRDIGVLSTKQPNPNSNTTTIDNQSGTDENAITFAQLARQASSWSCDKLVENATTTAAQVSSKSSRRSRPKIIVKQIYYHNYNEDIVAICLTEAGTKLTLISASATIYIIPIKNILLNLHAQQLRSSQGKSMYFYDASIISCMRPTDQPISIVHWESQTSSQRSYIVVACKEGNRLVHISVDDKREICSASVGESIGSIEVMIDRFSYSLLITCESLNQYRQTLELINCEQNLDSNSQPASTINLPKSSFKNQSQLGNIDDELVFSEKDFTPSWSSKPIPIRLQSSKTGAAAASAFSRVLTPVSRFGSQTNLLISDMRERPLSLIKNQTPDLIGVVDVLGAHNLHQQSRSKNNPKMNGHPGHSSSPEPRLLRFYSNKQYFYRPQRPQVICKLSSLDPNEMITHLVLTERFIAFATDRDRCIINSRNCCRLKNHSVQAQIELDPLVKEVTFNNEEKIMTLIKSPVTHDQDNILDSFILVTTRSIYVIDARHSCRDLFINLIDAHLAIKRTLFTPRPSFKTLQDGRALKRDGVPESHSTFNLTLEPQASHHDDCPTRSRSAESNLLINEFLQHRDVYERICHDSLAFSTLFKLELSSLYEAYADRLLQRRQFELANRFFQMANFDHAKILGKYVRIGAFNETIEYVKNILSDEHDFRKILSESERIELAKIAFECMLAKLVVERSKLLVYKTKLKRNLSTRLFKDLIVRPKVMLMSAPRGGRSPDTSTSSLGSKFRSETHPMSRADLYKLCEHSPRNREAKLSTTTIVAEQQDEEETLTSNTDAGDSSQRGRMALIKSLRSSSEQSRLECETALIDFVSDLMPNSMYEYAVERLLDFDLIELAESIAQTDVQICALVKALVSNREERRIVFRSGRLEPLADRLAQLAEATLAKIDTSKIEFLEFITSPRVTKALVGDISLTCEYYGYQHTLVQFRKYSFAALHHLETYRQLVAMQRADELNTSQQRVCRNKTARKYNTAICDFDDDANDGTCFQSTGVSTVSDRSEEQERFFSAQQKQQAESIFVEFLTACMDESTEDSCRLWFNYVNFYLNYVGDLRNLEEDILKLVESNGDCRLAISLYNAIHRDETSQTQGALNGVGRRTTARAKQGLLQGLNLSQSRKSVCQRESLISNTPLEAMRELHNLANLFRNEFLMKLLERTLDLLPQAADLDAITIATMC